MVEICTPDENESRQPEAQEFIPTNEFAMGGK